MSDRLTTPNQLLHSYGKLGERSKPILFTNGCFDPIHHGHLTMLRHSRQLDGYVVVALNSDESLRAIKGLSRPRIQFSDRLASLSDLRTVDHILCMSDTTPCNLLETLKPDVLFKGGDYQIEDIVGGDIVRSYGGKVMSLSFVQGISSTNIVKC